MTKKSSSSLGQEEHSYVETISVIQTEIKTEVAHLFDSFGFLSEILDHVLQYLFATSAFFQEGNSQTGEYERRNREEGRDRGRRKRIIVEAGDGGVNSREIGGWEENMK